MVDSYYQLMRAQILYFLFSDIKYLKGIGPILSKKISALCGGNKVFNLLCHKPSGVIDRTYMPRISEAEDKRVASFRVCVEVHEEPPRGRSSLPFKVICRNQSGFLQLIYFKMKAEVVKAMLPLGEERIVSGKVEHYGAVVQIMHPDRVGKLENLEKIVRFEPQYPLTAGVTQRKLQDTIALACEKFPELPEWQVKAEISYKDAIVALHNPKSEADLLADNLARRRLAYDELLAGQMAQHLVYRQVTKKPGIKVDTSQSSPRRMTGSSPHTTAGPRDKHGVTMAVELPFALTSDQKKAIQEIYGDMSSGNRMFRLLQGDVGSGKTAVGLLAMAPVVMAGHQGAFMVPTTLLARQQKEWFEKVSDLRVELLTGNEKGAKRVDILARLAKGEIDILVGTHALFQDEVVFKKLGIIIIDEQHRFGVLQRLKLSQKNELAHILLMTATPIPRSLTIANYGEMQISRIAEKPAGRKPVKTLASPIDDMGAILGSITRALDKGEKIYWICPLVEESEKSDLAAAQDRYEFFHNRLGGKVGLIHGRMKEAEKTAVLEKFLRGEHQLLVATTVIEVGIDVRDASVMFIEHSERFGLSQLHQLRGRIGRGDKESTCILLYSGRLGVESAERLKVMKKTSDGFVIAEEDLRIRGAGEVMGTRQSGFTSFSFAQMPEHEELLYKARDEAAEILAADAHLKSARGEKLKLLLSLFEYDESINYISAG